MTNKKELLSQFYKQCQENGYTDMNDASQSLKAKVIASDLGLNYNNIRKLYENAARAHKETQIEKERKELEEKQRSVDGKCLMILNHVTSVCVRQDGTYYIETGKNRIEGKPIIFYKESTYNKDYKYHGPTATYTSYTSAGFTTGSVTEGGNFYSHKEVPSGHGIIYYSINGTSEKIDSVQFPTEIREAYKRDDRVPKDGEISCWSGESSSDYYSNALARYHQDRNIERMLEEESYSKVIRQCYIKQCGKIVGLLQEILSGQLPPTDEESYTKAIELGAASSSQEIDEAIRILEKISDYKDAKVRIVPLKERYKEVLQSEKESAILKKEKSKKKRIILLVTAAILAVAIYFAVKMIIPNYRYNNATTLMKAGKYEDALTVFKALNGYKDSARQITDCENAIKDQKYDAAVALYNTGKYQEAVVAFNALNGYKDSTLFLENYYGKEFYEGVIKKATVGNYITFGAYEQDNNMNNGTENIEWLVLTKEDDRILVISKLGLDCLAYHSSNTHVTWKECSLRKWLNETFLNNAFSTEEQQFIASMTVTADWNPDHSASPGLDTTDKIFLLSIPEVKEFFSSDDARICTATEYAKAQGASTNKRMINGILICFWWLRTPGFESSYASCVVPDGSVSSFGQPVAHNSFCVRPALWINIGA